MDLFTVIAKMVAKEKQKTILEYQQSSNKYSAPQKRKKVSSWKILLQGFKLNRRKVKHNL